MSILLLASAATGISGKAEAEIVWSRSTYDFGLMKEVAGPATGSVSFVNKGPGEVVITGARPSCGCTSVEYPEDPIAPGDSARISFTYDPTGRPGKFEKSIRVYIGENDTYRIGIKGNVLGTPESLQQFYPYASGDLRLSDTIISAGEMKYGAARNFFINAYNQSPDSISPKWSVSNPALRVSCSDKKMGPGDIVSFGLYFNAGDVKEMGEVEIPVVFSYDPEDGSQTQTVIFRANVTPDFSKFTPEQIDNGPRCYPIPERIDLGILMGGKQKEFCSIIHNQGKERLNVLRVTVKDKAIKIKDKPSSIKPGKKGDLKFMIDVKALPAGPFNIPVDILSDDPLHPVRTVHVVGIKE